MTEGMYAGGVYSPEPEAATKQAVRILLECFLVL